MAGSADDETFAVEDEEDKGDEEKEGEAEEYTVVIQCIVQMNDAPGWDVCKFLAGYLWLTQFYGHLNSTSNSTKWRFILTTRKVGQV